MTRLERLGLSFIVVLNLFCFGVVFLVLSNGDSVGELTYVGKNDAGILAYLAIAGFLANLFLPWILLRVFQRRSGSARPRALITGE